MSYFTHVNDGLPHFNRYLLKDFVEKKVDDTIITPANAYEEASKFLQGLVKFVGYKILTPEERARYELESARDHGIPIATSELILVRYTLEYEGKLYDTHLYLPYMKDGAIVMNGTRYALQMGITEKVYAPSNGGVMVRVTRSPIHFHRTLTYAVKSVSSGNITRSFLVQTDLHNRSKDRRVKGIHLTVMHYLLARYGLREVLSKFGLNDNDISFVDAIGEDVDQYEYYLGANPNKVTVPPIFLRVRNEIINDPLLNKLVVNILYTVQHWAIHTKAEDMYSEPDGIKFRAMMGMILYPGSQEAAAVGYANQHLESVEYYLDPPAMKRIHAYGINVNTTYDLLLHVFCDIDRVMASASRHDLYTMRLDPIDTFMIEAVISGINKKVYSTGANINRLRGDKGEPLVKRMLRPRERAIHDIKSSPTVLPSPPGYNANMLISLLGRKILLNGSAAATLKSKGKKKGAEISLTAPEYRCHPSLLVVETAVAFIGKTPGITGLVNFFLEIDENGGIKRPHYADEIDPLLDYLA